MQSVSGIYTGRVKSPVRNPQCTFRVSWDKTFDASSKFFTIGSSSIGSTDIIQGSGAVIQEWDKYRYVDYSNRVLSVEYSRETQPPINALSLAMADIVLDNHDGMFTPENTSSPLYPNVKNGRPVRLYIGFPDTEALQVFVGLTQGYPNLDESNRTATFHCLDFLSQLQNLTLSSAVMTLSQRTDQVISTILVAAGLSTSQFVLDTGSVVIPFAFFSVGQNVADALNQIATAELGNVSMNENGTIQFRNRTNWAGGSQVWSLDRSNVFDSVSPSVNTVINSIQVDANARSVQAKQQVWSSTTSVVVPASGSIDVWTSFSDTNGDLPVTTIDTPTFNGATSQWLGSSTPTVSGVTLFGTTAKITFANASGADQNITSITLWGTPASVTAPITVVLVDNASITDNDARPLAISNDYIQDPTAANSIAQILLSDNSTPTSQVTKRIQGVPQLQLGDFIGYKDKQINTTYFVTKIDTLHDLSGLTQNVTLSQRTIKTYFRIGISSIGSTTDVIAP